MEISKKRLIIFAAAAFLGLLCGFFVAKGMYDRPLDESVSRDTVTLHDTVPEYLPSPKDSARIKYVTRWLPAVHDTVYSENYAQSFVEIMHDTVAVQVPITSKHYGGKNYDAYVSIAADDLLAVIQTDGCTNMETGVGGITAAGGFDGKRQ